MSRQNLIPAHRRAAWKLRRAIGAWMMGLGVLGVLVGGVVLGAFMTQATPQVMPVALREQLDLDKSKLALARARIARLKEVSRAHERAGSTPAWDGLLAVVAREASGRAQLKMVRVEPLDAEDPAWSLSLVGSAESKERSEALSARLQATGLFASVHHGASPRQPKRADIDFRIDCVIAPGGTP